MYLASINVDFLIKEDCPYFDLTGFELGINSQCVSISCFTREECIVCGTEESAAVFKRLGIAVEELIPSGTKVEAGTVLIKGIGDADAVLKAWKVIQNIIDHTSGVATKTRRLVNAASEENPAVSILTTRKMYPGTKALAVKAIMAGGARPHRLGTSETILVFSQHIELIGGKKVLLEKIQDMKKTSCEKKVLIETSELSDALLYLRTGVDGVQLEKLSPELIAEFVSEIRKEFPKAVILAAGGVNENNVREYAKTGVDGLVTTSVYTAEPIDIGVRIDPV